MISVRCNGVETQIEAAASASLGDVIESWRRLEPRRRRQVVTRVWLDGQDVSAETLSSLHATPIRGVAEVELETQNTRDVALASLTSSTEYSLRLREALLKTAELLRSGQIEAANRCLADIADAMTVLMFALTSASRELGELCNPLHGIEAQMEPWLQEVIAAQKVRDWIRMADYLEFEMEPILAEWGRKLETIRRAATDQEETDV